MTVKSQIAIARSLLDSMEKDADAVDAGKVGAAGTRVRKGAQEVKKVMGTLREVVATARDAAKAAKAAGA